jgi:hypothetical protein
VVKSQKYTPTTITRKSTRKTRKPANHTKNDGNSEDLENDELEDNSDVIPSSVTSRKRSATPMPSFNALASTLSDQEGDDTPAQKGPEKYLATPTSRKSKMSKLSFSSQESLSNVQFTNEKQKSDTQSSRRSVPDLFGYETSDNECERKSKPAIKNLFEKYNVDVESQKVDTEIDIDLTAIMDDEVKQDDKKKSKSVTTSKSLKEKEKENQEKKKVAKGGNMISTWLGRENRPEDSSKKPVASTSAPKSTKIKLPKLYKHAKPKKADREAVTNMEKQREKMAVTKKQLDDMQSHFNLNATQDTVVVL